MESLLSSHYIFLLLFLWENVFSESTQLEEGQNEKKMRRIKLINSSIEAY